MPPSAQPHCLDAVLTPTHRSPISRMLLRYRWQSCSTWGRKEGERTGWTVGRHGQSQARGDRYKDRTVPFNRGTVGAVSW